MIEKEIVIPIYNYGFTIVYGKNNDIVDKIEKQFSGIDISEYRFNKGGYIIITDHKKGLQYDYLLIFEDNYDAIYHESLHLAWNVLDRQGVKIDCDNHESLAYLMDWIANEIKKLINEDNGL